MISRRQIIEQQQQRLISESHQEPEMPTSRRKTSEGADKKRQDFKPNKQANQTNRAQEQQVARRLAIQKLEERQFKDHQEDEEAGEGRLLGDSLGAELEEPRTLGAEEVEGDDYRHFDPYSVYGDEDEEEDIWYSEERLFEEHIQEIVDKWEAIDDEIWAKIICMERNRRIAKAYARKHALTINGTQDEYLDGTTLGLNSFDNPDRDAKTSHIKQYIGQGLRIKISQGGDILVKRLSRANVFVHRLRPEQPRPTTCSQQPTSEPYLSDLADLYGVARPLGRLLRSAGGPSDRSSSSSESAQAGFSAPSWRAGGGLSLSSRALEHNKPVKVFDMAKFKEALAREARQLIPNRRKLQNQCISLLSFVLDDRKLLNLPSWIMVINIVAIDLLRNELGLASSPSQPAGPYESACESAGVLTRLQRLLGHAPQRRRPADDLALLKPAHLSSSSASSGFNSHCSSQNDSSAASSSSNLAPAAAAVVATPARPEPRGQRPPKLPHRLNQPPASANLILVAPTGISSPPLPPPIEFRNIKHIDENGHCRVLLERGHRLPAGIPPHAQLAPPALQRQILRFLRAAEPPALQPAPLGRRPLGPQRLQRPLPVPPPSARNPALDKQAESLYYGGLQARPVHANARLRAGPRAGPLTQLR